jgi:hypothetical protein
MKIEGKLPETMSKSKPEICCNEGPTSVSHCTLEPQFAPSLPLDENLILISPLLPRLSKREGEREREREREWEREREREKERERERECALSPLTRCVTSSLVQVLCQGF